MRRDRTMAGPFPMDPDEPYNVVQAFGRYFKNWKVARATDEEDARQRAEEMYLERRDERRRRGVHPDQYDLWGPMSHGVHVYGPGGFYDFYDEVDWKKKVAAAKLAVAPDLLTDWERRLIRD